MYYTYVLMLNNGKFYIGRTDNLKRRVAEHKNGKVRSTHLKLPRLIFYEAFLEKADSIRREKYLKSSKGKSTLRMMIKETLAKCGHVAELAYA